MALSKLEILKKHNLIGRVKGLKSDKDKKKEKYVDEMKDILENHQTDIGYHSYKRMLFLLKKIMKKDEYECEF